MFRLSAVIAPLMLSLAASAGVLSGAPTQAANIEMLTNHPEGCDAVLTGQIVDGDSARLARMFPPGENRFHYADLQPILCLDSPGGNLIEGLTIATYLRETGLRSHVTADGTCLSACALAFLGGTRFTVEDGLISNRGRSMHARAVLGFHPPQLDVPERAFSEREIRGAFDTAVRATAIIFGSLDKLRITRQFALSFFDVAPGEFYYIDTGFRAFEMGVEVTGVGPLPARIPDPAIRRICHVAFPQIDPAAYSDGFGVFQFVTDWMIDTSAATSPQSTAYVILTRGEGTLSYDACIISWNAADKTGYPPPLSAIFLGDIASDRGSYDDPRPPSGPHLRRLSAQHTGQITPLPAVMAGPEGSKLAQLAAPTVQQPRQTSDRPQITTCAPETTEYSVDFVQSFANLRRFPGFTHPVVQELPLGTRVKALRQPDIGAAILSPTCQTLCQSVAQTDDPAALAGQLESCREANMLWWQVQSPEGVTGWISRRFLVPVP